MGFTFSLQALLNWKRNVEELAQMRLAEKARELRLTEDCLERLRWERSSCEETLKEHASRGITASEFLLHREFLEHRTEAILAGQSRRKEIAREVEKERECLLGLMKERKKLERLKERRQRAFQKEVDKKEAKEQDDLSVMRYRLDEREAQRSD